MKKIILAIVIITIFILCWSNRLRNEQVVRTETEDVTSILDNYPEDELIDELLTWTDKTQSIFDSKEIEDVRMYIDSLVRFINTEAYFDHSPYGCNDLFLQQRNVILYAVSLELSELKKNHDWLLIQKEWQAWLLFSYTFREYFEEVNGIYYTRASGTLSARQQLHKQLEAFHLEIYRAINDHRPIKLPEAEDLDAAEQAMNDRIDKEYKVLERFKDEINFDLFTDDYKVGKRKINKAMESYPIWIQKLSGLTQYNCANTDTLFIDSCLVRLITKGY